MSRSSLLMLMLLVGCASNLLGSIRPYRLALAKGQVVVLAEKLNPLQETKPLQLKCGRQQIPFFVQKGYLFAFVGESYFSNQLRMDCTLEDRSIAQFAIEEGHYVEESLAVDKVHMNLGRSQRQRLANERQLLDKLYATSATTPYFNSEFISPITSPVTSQYGRKRIYNHQKSSAHLGTDFRADIGTELLNSNRGKVLFAGDLFNTGLTVIVDHGLSIISIYGHLSKLSVAAGQIVEKGELLGKSGKSGRVTGPHLHWAIRLNGEWIDPITFAKESEKLFSALRQL